jgi:hypothetical protein
VNVRWSRRAESKKAKQKSSQQRTAAPRFSGVQDFNTLPGAASLKGVLFDDVDRRWLYKVGTQLKRSSPAPAAFVGSGLSKSLGYDTWGDLLDKLHALAFKGLDAAGDQLSRYAAHVKSIEDMTWRAQEYRDALADEQGYRRFLRQAFQSKGKTSVALDTLVKMPFRHFFTTNYDRELEMAYRRMQRKPLDIVDWTDAQRSADLVARWNEDRQPSCVYLHGCISRPETVILTEQDYQRVYFRTGGNAQRLAAILLLHPVVFMGFSLTDPDLMALLRQVNTLCFEGVRHYALIGLRTPTEIAGRSAERARLRRKFGVAAIFFKPGENYRGLEHVLTFLSQANKWSDEAPPEAPPAKITEAYCHRPNENYRDDPLKGRFGGASERGNWKVQARIGRDPGNARWFRVRVEVSARPGSRARLRGRVDYFVHPTFPQYRYYSFTNRNGVASYTFYCIGGFTLGVQVHQDNTFLELDLSEIDAAPLDFQFT